MRTLGDFEWPGFLTVVDTGLKLHYFLSPFPWALPLQHAGIHAAVRWTGLSGTWDLSHETGAASDVMLRGYGSQESRERAKGLCSTAICLPGTLGTCQYYYERINHYLTFLRITFCAANGRVGLSFSYMIYDVGWFIYITLCTWTEQGASFAMNSLLR